MSPRLHAAGAQVTAEAVAAAQGFPTLQTALAGCLESSAASHGRTCDPRASIFMAFHVLTGQHPCLPRTSWTLYPSHRQLPVLLTGAKHACMK